MGWVCFVVGVFWIFWSSCSFGNLRCVYCVAVFLGLCFGLFGGMVCPLVWCGVLVLLWESFVECFVVCWCVFDSLAGLSAQICCCVLGSVFWLFGGVPCPRVWCGVLGSFLGSFWGPFLGSVLGSVLGRNLGQKRALFWASILAEIELYFDRNRPLFWVSILAEIELYRGP